MNIPLITFIIPLVSKAHCADWDEVMTCFRNTLASIASQSRPDYRILVVCNESPDICLDPDRTTILNTNISLKNNNLGSRSLDKERKMHAGLLHVRSARSGYVMFLDADDLISRHVVEFVDRNPDYDAFIVDRGYVYEKDVDWAFPVNRFYLRCGSSYIFRYRESDTPDSPQFKLGAHWMIRAHNKRVISRLEQHGYRYTFFPFPAAVYIRGHQDSLSSRRRAAARFAPMIRAVAHTKRMVKRALCGTTLDVILRHDRTDGLPAGDLVVPPIG